MTKEIGKDCSGTKPKELGQHIGKNSIVNKLNPFKSTKSNDSKPTGEEMVNDLGYKCIRTTNASEQRAVDDYNRIVKHIKDTRADTRALQYKLDQLEQNLESKTKHIHNLELKTTVDLQHIETWKLVKELLDRGYSVKKEQ